MIGYLSQRRGRGFKSRRHSTGCVVDERPKSLKRRLAPTLLVPLLTPRRAAQAWAHPLPGGASMSSGEPNRNRLPAEPHGS
jgi:hypothetical protein